jgi:cathepsin H
MKILILCVGILILQVAANVHLNVKYRDVLHGKAELTEETSRQIYSEFATVYARKSESHYEAFRDTLNEIREHNLKNLSWTQGINDYSDLTFEQFAALRLMAPQNCSATHNLKVSDSFKNLGIPESFEWNNFGVVTPVKNQASCGSCWTFSTVGSLEAFWNIQNKGKNVTFSEQQLVDCAGDFNNFGCSGGLPSQAFEYIRHAGGIQTDLTYTYKAVNQVCAADKTKYVGQVKYGSYNITEGDEVELAERLYIAGPIAISFQVINGFKNYMTGVYSVAGCGKTTQDINHAVLATGYGTENGMKFWNVKNSWGTSFGNQGYFKIEREKNMCAIAMCNSYPLLDRPTSQGLEEVTV